MLTATGLGVGLLPGIPGTWASLAAVPVAWLIREWIGVWSLAAATAAVFVIGWWAAARIVRGAGTADPGFVVIDEIAAQWLVLTVVPQRLWAYAAAFIAFRLFDIWKPFPVSWLDRTVKGGLGIMLDDVMAAIYAWALIAICAGIAGVRF